MIPFLLTVALAASAPGTTLDTTLAVRPGTRLELETFSGSIHVGTWSRDAIRIEATHGRDMLVDIDRSGQVLSVAAAGRMGQPGRCDFTLTVPAAMALRLEGVGVDVTVDGAQGRVEVETVQGGVIVRGGRERVTLSSVQGAVRLEGARGRIEVSAINEAVELSDIEGDVSVESVNGGVTLTRMRARSVDASSVNGDVRYEGALLDGGEYHFSSHAGALRVCVPATPDVRVGVSTLSGEFRSDFPLPAREAGRHTEYEFTLGEGRAGLELESFLGRIELCRAGARSSVSPPDPKSREDRRSRPADTSKPHDTDEEE